MWCHPVRCINTSNVNIGSTTVTITIEPNLCRLGNCTTFDIVLNACLQTDQTPRAVQMTLNGSTVPVLSKCGNVLYSDQLRCGCTYTAVYGTNTPHVSILSNVCPTKYVPPTTPPSPGVRSKSKIGEE